MLKKMAWPAVAARGSIALLLAGCSGSSFDDSPAPPGIARLSGVVFAASKCAHVRVDILAASGAVLAQAQTDGNGNYAADFANPPSSPARYLSASCPNADGSEETLFSPIPADMAVDANAAQTVNLNGPATLLSALLTHSGDPSKLGDELRNGALTIDAPRQATARSQLSAMLQQLVKAAGLVAFDPVTTPMNDDARITQLLQAASIRFLPGDDGSRTVQIRLKLASRSEADGQPVFQARAADLADAGKLQSLTAMVGGVGVGAAALAPAEAGARIDDLVARMNRCASMYALPLGEANKTAACSAIFVDGDRDAYRSDGLRYFDARDEKTFDVAAIESTGQPVDYSAPSFEYLRPDGILGFAVLRRSPDGMRTMSLDARIGADGRLGLCGNQYPFHMRVMPHAERRSFLHQPSSNYLSTGYRLNVPLQTRGGATVTKVVVTPPAGMLPNTSFTLVPGATEMVLAAPDGSPNQAGASAFVRLRSQYAEASLRQRHPSLRDTSQTFVRSDLDDAAIAAIVPYAEVWKAQFHLDGSAVPEATQYYRVPARPPTIAELRATALPDLSADSRDMIAGMLSRDAQGVGITPLSGMPALTLTATGASPLYLSVHGVISNEATGALAFRDAPSFPVYVTRDLDSPLLLPRFAPRPASPGVATTVFCADGLNGDRHCSSKENYADPSAATVSMTGVELLAYPADPVGKAHFLSVMPRAP